MNKETNIALLGEKAQKVINLYNTMKQTFTESPEEDLLKIAIMAGLKDMATESFNKGYCSRPA
jgi:hypothetical protein